MHASRVPVLLPNSGGNTAKQILATAVGSWDVSQYDPGYGQMLQNRGTGGPVLDAYFGSSGGPTAVALPGVGVSLPGISGNYLSVPDAAAVSITGDIDIIVCATLPNWNTGSHQALLAKWGTAVSRSYYLRNDSAAGGLAIVATPDGTSGSAVVFTSSVPLGFTPGARKWVRATLDVDNGAGGKTATFYTSDDGTNWAQLGAPVTIAGTMTVFDGTDDVRIGEASGALFATGVIHRAIVKSGIGGTTVLDVDASVCTAPYQPSFTATTGQSVTINRTVPGITSRVLPGVGVQLPGVAGNHLSVPDAANLRITGDLELVARVIPTSWSVTSPVSTLIARRTVGSAFQFRIHHVLQRTLDLVWWTATVATVKSSTVQVPFADGEGGWVKVTFDVDNGASGNDIKFWTAPDQATEPTSGWVQLGATVTTAGVTSIDPAVGSDLLVGATSTSTEMLSGIVKRAIMRNGIGGTTVLDIDASVCTDPFQSAFLAVTGQVVTINRSGADTNDPTVLPYNGKPYVYLPSTVGNYLSVPDAANLRVTGDFELIQYFVPTLGSGFDNLLRKNNAYHMAMNFGTRILTLTIWSDAVTGEVLTASAAAPMITGVPVAVRATRRKSDGRIQFFTGPTVTGPWTQVGTDLTGGTYDLYGGGTSPVYTGNGVGSGYSALRSIITSDGTTVLDIDTSVLTTGSAQTFSALTGQTVTINRSTTGRKTVAVVAPVILFGTDDFLKVLDNDLLNFALSDSMMVLFVGRSFSAPPGDKRLMSKWTSDVGYQLTLIGTTGNVALNVREAAPTTASVAAPNTGALIVAIGARDTAADQVKVAVNGTTVATADNSTATMSNATPLYIGSQGGTTAYADVEFFAAHVFRKPLTASEIAKVTAEMQKRFP